MPVLVEIELPRRDGITLVLRNTVEGATRATITRAELSEDNAGTIAPKRH